MIPNLLDEFVSKPQIPNQEELIRYIFWEKGIGYHEFNSYPLPYIFQMLKVFNYIKKEEEKAHKKAMRKK